MAEKPILFNTEMVRAILDGQKTQTRRIMKRQPPEGEKVEYNEHYNMLLIHNIPAKHGPFEVGDVLWVRETFATWSRTYGSTSRIVYRADVDPGDKTDYEWFPSIHMPRDIARIYLRVKDVRAERLQEISDEDAKREGANHNTCVYEKMKHSARDRFAGIWDSTIKKADLPLYGWDANPWVWVVEFERITDGGDGDD